MCTDGEARVPAEQTRGYSLGGATLATQSFWALPEPQGLGVSSSGVRKTVMEAGWRQHQHGLARATGILAPFQRCSSRVLGTARTPRSSWQARCHTNHTVQVEPWTLATHFFCPYLLFL